MFQRLPTRCALTNHERGEQDKGHHPKSRGLFAIGHLCRILFKFVEAQLFRLLSARRLLPWTFICSSHALVT